MPSTLPIGLQLERGMLEQTCAVCGQWEAAGMRCSKCIAVTGEPRWYRNGDLTKRGVR